MPVLDANGNTKGVEIATSFDDDGPDREDAPRLRYKKPNVAENLINNLYQLSESELKVLFDGLDSSDEWFDEVSEAYTSSLLHDEWIEN